MSMMLTFRAGKVAMLLALLSLTAACSREQQDWRSAEAADTAEGYGQFLERHPESELATQARARVAQLSEDREWQRAVSSDTADAYRQFLAQHPSGKWAQEARIRIENFSLGGPPVAETSVAGSPRTTAPAATTAMAPTGELARAPASSSGQPAASGATRSAPADSQVTSTDQPPTAGAVASSPAKPTSSAPSQAKGYGVQLGAFSSEGAATNEWQQLTGRFGPDLRGLAPHVVAANTATGHIFRLQAQVADESRARAICDSLKKQSQACVPVLPH
jgi:cell division septation protein DedD